MKKLVLFIVVVQFAALAFSQHIAVGEDLLQNVGDTVVVSGKIYGGAYLVHVITKPTFLNLGDTSPNHRLIIRIDPEDRGKFPTPPEVFYLNKTVQVSGKLQDYKGTPLIRITEPETIKTLPALIDSVNDRTNTYAIVAKTDSNALTASKGEAVYINRDLKAIKPDSIAEPKWVKSVADRAAEEKLSSIWLVSRAVDMRTEPVKDAPVIARLPVGVLISILYTTKKWSFVTVSSIDGFRNVNGFIRHRKFRHLKRMDNAKKINNSN